MERLLQRLPKVLHKSVEPASSDLERVLYFSEKRAVCERRGLRESQFRAELGHDPETLRSQWEYLDRQQTLIGKQLRSAKIGGGAGASLASVSQGLQSRDVMTYLGIRNERGLQQVVQFWSNRLGITVGAGAVASAGVSGVAVAKILAAIVTVGIVLGTAVTAITSSTGARDRMGGAAGMAPVFEGPPK